MNMPLCTGLQTGVQIVCVDTWQDELRVVIDVWVDGAKEIEYDVCTSGDKVMRFLGDLSQALLDAEQHKGENNAVYREALARRIYKAEYKHGMQ